MYEIFEIDGGYGYNIKDNEGNVLCTQPFNPYKSGFSAFSFSEAGSYASIARDTTSYLEVLAPEVANTNGQVISLANLISFPCTCKDRHTSEERMEEDFKCDCELVRAIEWTLPATFKVTFPDGSVEETIVHPEKGSYTFSFVPTLVGEHMLEVIADAPFGTKTVTINVG
jgi:hypothetical protein